MAGGVVMNSRFYLNGDEIHPPKNNRRNYVTYLMVLAFTQYINGVGRCVWSSSSSIVLDYMF